MKTFKFNTVQCSHLPFSVYEHCRCILYIVYSAKNLSIYALCKYIIMYKQIDRHLYIIICNTSHNTNGVLSIACVCVCVCGMWI